MSLSHWRKPINGKVSQIVAYQRAEACFRPYKLQSNVSTSFFGASKLSFGMVVYIVSVRSPFKNAFSQSYCLMQYFSWQRIAKNTQIGSYSLQDNTWPCSQHRKFAEIQKQQVWTWHIAVLFSLNSKHPFVFDNCQQIDQRYLTYDCERETNFFSNQLLSNYLHLVRISLLHKFAEF